MHDDRRRPVGGSIDADLRLERTGERAVVQGSCKEVSQSLKNGFMYFTIHTLIISTLILISVKKKKIRTGEK